MDVLFVLHRRFGLVADERYHLPQAGVLILERLRARLGLAGPLVRRLGLALCFVERLAHLAERGGFRLAAPLEGFRQLVEAHRLALLRERGLVALGLEGDIFPEGAYGADVVLPLLLEKAGELESRRRVRRVRLDRGGETFFRLVETPSRVVGHRVLVMAL